MKFRWCPPGEFKMGESPNQVDVKLTCGFWLGKYEVTQGQYRQVMNDPFPDLRCDDTVPAGADADTLPVMSVSRSDAVEFCRLLTGQERRAGRLPSGWEYRLPTEAQWEYACRASTQTRYCFGDDESQLGKFAWYEDNADGRTHEVGQKLPNAWGLHDMHGNVCEWCRDAYQDTLVGGEDPEVVKARGSGSDGVFRGGSWFSDSAGCRPAAHRHRLTQSHQSRDLGFRIALVQPR
jgi:formylglycine-generating enzyme required for sulfatase activity